ncbi:MAG: hypothetical protein WCR63_02360 [Bacilli bacterium]
MDGLRLLSENECEACSGGEALTLAGIMAILAIAIIAVVCYRFFVSAEGEVKLPGGFQFEWGRIR